MSDTLEREYAYQPSWLTIVCCGVFFAACAAVIGYEALTNQRGIRLFRIFTLAPHEATVSLWALAAISMGFVLIAFVLAWHRLTFKQRLALTASGIVLPVGRWSRAECFIAYHDMRQLESISANRQRFLHIHHVGGKHSITASMLPSELVFDEVCGILASKLPQRA